MKKAKDYATEYIATGKTVDSLTNIIHEMVYETRELMQIRRLPRSDLGIFDLHIFE